MSKKQKTIRSEKRKAAKRSERAARKAHYEALRDAKQNTKSKNKMRREGTALVKNFSHPSGPCHNVGCQRCFPTFQSQREKPRDVFAPKRQLSKPWGAP